MSDTFRFLTSVLPAEGYPVITHRSTREDGKQFWKNNAFPNIQEAVGWAKWLNSKGYEAYFACASFREVTPIEGKRNRFAVERKQVNVHSLQAFWADLDIKPEGEHHRTGKEALIVLRAACLSLGIPFPMVVKSGRGLHVYWLLREAAHPLTWLPVARALERALLDHDVLIDKGVTTDSARILRPVGTLWMKETPYREVSIYREMDERHNALWYQRQLEEYTQASDHQSFFQDAEDEFSSGMYPPEDIDANAVAKACAQVGAFKEARGDVKEPLWYATLGLLKHCTNGEDIAQDWSRGHPDYDPDVTAAKIAQWKAGPTTCNKFKDLNPSACAGCPHQGKVKTPLRLGKTGASDTSDNTHPSDRVKGYEWDPTIKSMVAIRKDEDGELMRLPFCKTRFWLHNYILEDGMATLVIYSEHERFGREDVVDEHTIKMSTVGGGGRELAAQLAGIMLTDTSGQKQLSRSFLLDYQEYLKRSIREIQTYRQFGWLKDDEFLMGDRIITPDKEFEVRLGGQATAKTGLYDTSQDPGEWTRVVNDIYNQPYGEPYQFVICSGLGSILVPLLGLEEFSGIPIAVTSDESGYGKTTVCWVALSTLGAVRRGLNVLSGDEASLLSMEWQLAIFNHMPSLFDEQTNRDGVFTSNMLYMMSNGTARARGTSDGKLREMAPPWKGNNLLTGNRNIFYKLTENKANPEAAQMRVFEISLDEYPKLGTLRNAQALSHDLNKIRSGYGKIGVDFIRYVMANRERIKEVMARMPETYFKGMHHDKERFYVNAAVCSLTAGMILKKLGYIDFDMKKLAQWTAAHILKLRTNVAQMRKSTEDMLGSCLTSLCQRLLVTDYMDRGTEQDPVVSLRGDVAGRVATVDRRCYITLQAMTDWCQKNGVQWTKFRSSLVNDRLLSDEMLDDGTMQPSIRINLGKGVKGYTTGVSRVVALDYNKLARTLSELTVPDNVVAIRGPADGQTADIRGPGRDAGDSRLNAEDLGESAS